LTKQSFHHRRTTTGAPAPAVPVATAVVPLAVTPLAPVDDDTVCKSSQHIDQKEQGVEGGWVREGVFPPHLGAVSRKNCLNSQNAGFYAFLSRKTTCGQKPRPEEGLIDPLGD